MVDSRQRAELDEETDPLSTLSSSLSLLFQIASTSLYRLSSSTHIQLNPSIPPHVHSTQPTASSATANNAAAAGPAPPASAGLIPPNEMASDIKELVDDFMDRVGSMKEGIEALPVSVQNQEHLQRCRELDEQIRAVDDEYEKCVEEAKQLEKQVEALLDQSCP